MIYLDNAASSWPKPESVMERTRAWMLENGANPGRSNHQAAMAAASAIRESRDAVARLLGGVDPQQIAFGPNATWALNTALRGSLDPEEHVVSTVLEHNSVLRPLSLLREERGVEVTLVEPDASGRVDPDAVVDALRPETRLVALIHASNVVGVIQPVAEITRAVREARGTDVLVLVDAAQTAGVLDLPVVRWDVDLVAMAGHKGLFGLQGTGALYVREGAEPDHLVAGGTGSRSHETRHPEEMPDRLEAGTANTPGIVSLGAGVDYVLETGLETIRRRERRQLERLLEGLREIPGVTVHNPEGSPAVAVALFDLAGGDPVEAAFLYDRRHGIAVRAGLHCAPLAHRWLGTLEREPSGALRASPGFFTTDEDVDRFLEATRDLAERVG